MAAFNPKNCVLGDRLGFFLEENRRYYSRRLARCQYPERNKNELAALLCTASPDKHGGNRR